MRVPVGSWCSSPGKDSERCSASCSSVTLVWFLIRLWFAFFKKPSHFPEGGARSSIQIQQTPHCECNYRCRLSRGSRSKRRRKKEEIKSKCIQKRNQSLDAFYQPPKHILTASFANDNSQNFTPLKWNLPARFCISNFNCEQMCSSPQVAKRGLFAVFLDNQGDQVIMHLSITMILLTRGLSLINNVT